MNETTFSFPSKSKGKHLTATVFLPEQEPIAIVAILHGLAEHIGRYRRFAEALTEKGFLLVGHDHLGHGPFVPEEDRGFFAEDNGWEIVCLDAAAMLKETRRRYPDLPLFLLGHSMGSFIARAVYLRGMAPLDGLILSGTGNMSSLLVAGGKLIGNVEKLRLRGKKKVSPLVTSLALGGYDKPFKGEGQNAWISSLGEEVARYNADPLCGFPVTLGMFLDMFDGISYIVKPKNIKNADRDTPILLVAGENDPVGNMGKGVMAAYRAFGKAGVEDISVILYEGCRHEIFNDACRDKALQDIAAWLYERMG